MDTDMLCKRPFRSECNQYSRVEAGPNTSPIAQQVVGGDEKGTQCLGV
jgi:hypothetical protein